MMVDAIYRGVVVLRYFGSGFSFLEVIIEEKK
jgi:hypothetical protein